MDTAPPTPSRSCPDDETWAALAAGGLGASERDALHEHVDGCPECAEVMTALGRAYFDGDERPPSASDGRYAVRGMLGRGGMGVVWRAYDRRLDREIAIKVLRDDIGDHARRLQAEARAMAAIDHPNVVRVFDVGSWDGRAYVAMELVDGVDLRTWISRTHPSPAAIHAAFAAAARGLSAAHAVGLVHRDFKPDNVFVGADGRICVGDFGMVAVTPRAGTTMHGASVHTRTGVVLGTFGYLAPEQIDGAEVDARTDQFAWCVALWEALAGVRPFEADDLADLRARQRQPPRPHAALEGHVARVLARGLAEHPHERWPDLEALRAALVRPRSPWRRLPPAAAAVIAIALTWSSPDPTSEGDAPRLEAPPVEAPRRDAEVERIAAIRDRGELALARTRVDTLIADRQDAQDDVGLAQALWLRGTIRDTAGDLRGAAEDFREAAFLAEAHDDVPTAIDAAIAMVALQGAGFEHESEAQGWIDHAEALLARRPDPAQAAVLIGVEALIRLHQRRAPEASALAERAVAELAPLRAADDPVLLRLRYNLAMTRLEADQIARGTEELQTIVAVLGRVHGPGHPLRIKALLDMSHLARERGEPSLAIEHVHAAIAALEGSDHRELLADAHHSLGGTLAEAGRLDEAEREFAAARELWRSLFGDAHPSVAVADRSLGQLALLRGDGAGARAACERARVVEELARRPGDRGRVETEWCLARAALALGEPARAAELISALLGSIDPGSSDACQLGAALGHAWRLAEAPEAARIALATALPICVRHGDETAEFVPEIREDLAALTPPPRRIDRRATAPGHRRG